MTERLRYIRKPLPVIAIQITVENIRECAELLDLSAKVCTYSDGTVSLDYVNPQCRLQSLVPGDYILTTEQPDDIWVVGYSRGKFEAMYEQSE